MEIHVKCNQFEFLIWQSNWGIDGLSSDLQDFDLMGINNFGCSPSEKKPLKFWRFLAQ
jgi:hypothetical protein